MYVLNTQFLKHDTLTDIITFEYSDKISNSVLAQIYISIDRVRENAKHLKVSFFKELLRVIAHGMLHIKGYDDKTSKEKEIMRYWETYHILRFYR